MNKSVNPCDDFYNFACGKYLVNSTHYKFWPEVSPSIQLEEKVEYQVKHAIESITQEDPEYLQKLSSFYWSCMDDGIENKNSKAEIMETMEKLGGWPVLNRTWNESNFDWKETMYAFRNTGLSISSFLDINFGPDIRNRNTTIIMDEPKLIFDPSKLTKGSEDAFVKKYFDYMVDLAEILGANRSYAIEELNNSLHFEIEMAKIKVKSDDLTISDSYNSIKVKELSELCPHVPWLDYLTNILQPPNPIQPSDSVIVNSPSNIREYCELFDRTSNRTMANYAFFNFVSYFANLLGPGGQKIVEQFHADVFNRPILHPSSKWKKCSTVAQRRMSMAVGTLFIKKYFNHDTKSEASKIVKVIQDQMMKSIEQVSWMTNRTKKFAEEKLESMKPLIAYPDHFLDEKRLNEIYINLTVNRHSYLESTLNLNRLDYELAALDYRQPVDSFKWPSSIDLNPASVNAAYSLIDNSFVLHAGMLQRPFFHAENTKYINFGGIGTVIAHEISHGFDGFGRQFDKYGRKINESDIDFGAEEKFFEKIQCLLNQSISYGLAKNIKVDAAETLQENVADNIGVKQAYLAYDAWLSNRTMEPRLDGLKEFSPRQLFWLSHANTMCERLRPGARRRRRQVSSSYLPNHMRILVAYNNMPEFARDFNCPLGSFMNHEEKCDMW
ncbi:hypothetical protein QAD02_006093 [Eretmocerus hayati]|uniref:Uncharacterized protein n=1 Tax=Eretmocerus hayati TaxID=131215 RepID=A0ACC2N0E3_9HYME|nr:hypothetical protein QAD02_006093 [Eretmocerus hayati]